MGLILEHLAVIFGAATGPLAARGKGVDLFGVIVLGFVTAVGGGTLRDLILNEDVFWVHDGQFLISAVLTATVSFYIAEQLSRRESWLLWPDALGLAFATMLGTAKAFRLGHSPAICMTMGIMTGVAGGMLRDLILGRIPLVFRPEINLYATAAAVGAGVFVLIKRYDLLPQQYALVAGAAVIVLLRLAAMKWHWRLPGLDAPRKLDSPDQSPKNGVA
jgi:uncharacterized membrane protein YeiH